MNYYQHHIGDFIRDTARLTDSQCMAYMRMLWIYYETESPLESDVDAIAFKIGANASDVHQILKHYFFEHEGNWHNSRCDKEILSFREKSNKAKKSANARWENANAMRTHTERNANEPVLDANQEPITSNQEPITKDKKPLSISSTDVRNVFEHWQSAMNSPKSKLDANRTNLITKSLKLGYSVDDLKAAIAGCKKSAFHMGVNDQSKLYNGLDLILRNAENIDKFIAIAANVIPIARGSPSQPSGQARNFEQIDYTAGVDANGRF